jgi:hypothetical protein
MASPCSDIEAFITALEKRRDQLIDILTTRQAEGGRTDAIRRQIKELQSQILQEMILLKKIMKKTPAVTPRKHFVFIEKTQCIQYFDTGEYLFPETIKTYPNNGIPMISGRTVLLRVYIDGSFDNQNIALPPVATGKLLLQTLAGEITISPVKRSVVVRDLSKLDRLNIDHTLNFLIPAEYCNRQLICKLLLTNDETGDSFYSAAQTIDFIELPALKVHLINIHYTGTGYNENPSGKTTELTDILASLNNVLQVFPLSHFSITGMETIEWNYSLKYHENCGALQNMISMMRNISGNNALFIGIVPAEAGYHSTGGKDNIGSGTCIISAGAGLKNTAHEIGRALGRLDAPCYVNENGDINYPPYYNFPPGSIGEAGIDLRSFECKDPSLLTDYMSNCNDASWTSPHGYLQLLKIMQEGPFCDHLANQPNKERKQIEYYHADFHRDHLQHTLSITSAYHVCQPMPEQSLIKHGSIRAYFYSTDNVLMYSGFASNGTAGHPTSGFQLSFPQMDNMQRIQLVENNFSIGEFYIAPTAPQVYITGIDFREETGNRLLHLTWEANTAGPTQPSLNYAVRYSADGLQWYALLVNINTNFCTVNLDELPGGPACRIQILASAGLRTSIAETYHFQLPVKPRQLYCLHPKPQAVYNFGQPVYCSATAYSPNFKNALPEEVTWTSLKHGYLGSGQQLVLTNLAPGKHWIQVHIAGGVGNLLTKQIEILVV